MARSVNKVILIGNVGRNPDDHVTAGGKKVAHFSLATNRRVGGESAEHTDWHRITVWNRRAQFVADYVRKGDRVYVEGHLEYDSHERDGMTIPTAEIMAREVVLLHSASAG